jgi:hypothetical protein
MNIPSLESIVANKQILSPESAKLLRLFIDGSVETDGQDIIVFYTQAMHEDEYDEHNTLNIHVALSDDYLDFLWQRHMLEYGWDHEGWDDSLYYFKNLKPIRDEFMGSLIERQKQKKRFTDVLDEYSFKLESIPVEVHAIPYYMPRSVGSQYRGTRDGFYKKTRGSGGGRRGRRAKRATNKRKTT